MPDYTKSKIYKIVGEDGSTYYGSTTEKYINNRLAKHRFTTSTAYTKIMSQMEFTIEIIEEFPCSSKQELEDREAYYIRNYECVNKNIPNRTPNEYRIDNIDKKIQQMKQYYIDNRDKIKQYYIDNRDKQLQQMKQYYIDNRDKQLQYKIDNRDKIKQCNFERYHYINSWGGDPRSQNNLLQIDINIFA